MQIKRTNQSMPPANVYAAGGGYRLTSKPTPLFRGALSALDVLGRMNLSRTYAFDTVWVETEAEQLTQHSLRSAQPQVEPMIVHGREVPSVRRNANRKRILPAFFVLAGLTANLESTGCGHVTQCGQYRLRIRISERAKHTHTEDNGDPAPVAR